MHALMGFITTAIVLLAMLVLYIGGAALVLRIVDWLRPAKKQGEQDSSLPASTA